LQLLHPGPATVPRDVMHKALQKSTDPRRAPAGMTQTRDKSLIRNGFTGRSETDQVGESA